MNSIENSSTKSSELRSAVQLGINSEEASTWNAEDFKMRARTEKENKWKAEHAEFIKAYNQSVEEDSLPLDALRTF